ncbi:DUF4214 domain-containing protein [Pseudoduganella namucuonensis]|nr:DUF4214 domain-containing protein [Pseudoduganella namucuonensis]
MFAYLQHLTLGLARAPGRLTAAALAGALLAACGGGNDAAVAPAPAAARLMGGAVQGGVAPTVQAASTDEAYHEVVQRIYIAYFGRPADPAGLAYWAGQFRRAAVPATLPGLTAAYAGSATVRGLVDSFGASQESKDLYSGDNDEFITAIYRNIFGKEPDMAGKNYWRGLVESAAITRTFAALAIMAGAQAEDIDVVNNKIEVANSFTAAISEARLNASYNGNDANASARTMLGMVNAVTTVVDFQPAVAATVTTLAPAGYETLVATGKVLTDIKVQNTGAAQTSVPVTFGQIFVKGQLLPKEGLAGKLADGSAVALQMDVKATHDDGSVRHAIVSGVVPKLAAGQTQVLTLAKSGPATTPSTVTPQALLSAGLTGSVALTVNGVQYSAALRDALLTASPVRWLSGPVVNEWIAGAPLKTAAGAVHPHLTARFGVRWYNGLSKTARIEVIVENNKTFTAAPRNYSYDVNVQIDGRAAYSQTGMTHYHHSRWHKYLWWNPAGGPAVHLRHNTAYLIASKAVPNYDQGIVTKEAALTTLASTALTAAKIGPMKIGALKEYMPTSGGRPDIGPLPSWSVMYLLTMDARAKQSMMEVADGSGTWSIHYRDDATGHPIRLDNAVNKMISTHGNLNHRGPLPVPRCANNDWSMCSTPYTPDTAHQPSMAFLPYLVTGDHFYLEELQFWAAWNPTGTDPGAHAGKGLVRWQQLRGQAWSLRTLGHAAYITPDTHYMKAYFNNQLSDNLEFYHTTYVTGNPNALGVYDGSGPGAFASEQSAPWQDDFFTWSFGYLAELGYAKAEPILRWKAKFPVGRMTALGYCWVEGAPYYMYVRNTTSRQIFATFAEAYAATFKEGAIKDDDGNVVTHPLGLPYLTQPCGSQAQADWRTAAGKRTWAKGQMLGYAGSNLGYPSNMQPALAVAASSGIPNARAAWTIFANRSVKPDYSTGPQFAILPR